MLLDLSDPENRWYIGITFARKLFTEGHLTHPELKALINGLYSPPNSLDERLAFRELHRLADKHQDLYHKFRTLNTLKGHPIGSFEDSFGRPMRSRRHPNHDQNG